MHSPRKWLAGIGVVALLAAGAVWGQSLYTFNLTGSEIANLALPGGGSGIQTPAYVLRNGSNHTLVATGSTVATTVPNTSEQVIATGAITTWNITLPTSPYAGQRVGISCPGGDTTTLAIAATAPAGVALVGTNPTSCT